MRFYPGFISFVLLLGAVLLLPVSRAYCQGLQSGLTTVAAEDLPDAPEPQYGVASLGFADEQPIAGQTGSDAGAKGEQRDNPTKPQAALDSTAASISGTVTNVNGEVVPGATILLEGADSADRRTAVASDNGAFQFDNLKPGISYGVTIKAANFEGWKSPPILLKPGQYLFLPEIKLKLPESVASVTVYASTEQIATEQVVIAEHQRVLGVIPNFWVTYDPNPVPLTAKLKFRLVYRTLIDPMTFVGVAFLAAIYQAADTPDFGQGWTAYAQRVGTGYADTTTDLLFGGAVLPSLLRQDPRYFYQGTGTKKSRAFHAMSAPFVCKGDNGKTQPNYSSMGGDLISGAISNLYYPKSDRGVALLFEGFALTTGIRVVDTLIQEFLLRKLTPNARKGN
jgi:hypothetical protein